MIIYTLRDLIYAAKLIIARTMLTIQPDIKELPTPQLSWKDSVAVQKVLDVLCQILAEEYCKTAREHSELFTTKG